jgi:uncharacterized membrane protein
VFPDSVLTYVGMAGLNLVVGRAAGMSFGYASSLGHAQVIPLNVLVETIKVLVLYPLFVLSGRQLIRVPRLQSFVKRMHSAAELRGGVVREFGIAGLFVFVLTPLWMTGPVVGAIIGFMMGLRARVILPVVLGGTYLAIGLWGLLLNELNAWAASVNRFAPYILVLAMVLIAVALHGLSRVRERPAGGAGD